MKFRNERTLSPLLQLSVVLFLQGFSTLASASDSVPQKMRSGRVPLTLDQQEQNNLALLQLTELVSPVLFYNVPVDILEQSNFSCSDDGRSLAEKFAKLAMNLKYSMAKNKKFLSAIAYEKAALSLESTTELSKMMQWDYYLSLAQYKSWAAHNLFGCGQYSKGLELFLQAWEFLDEADHSLEYIRSVDMGWFRNFIDSLIDKMNEGHLREMAEDAVTEIRLWDQENVDSVIATVVKRRAETQEKTLATLSHSENVKKMALALYQEKQIENLSRQIPVNSVEEKRRIIKSQNPVVNYHKLVALGYILEDVQEALVKEGYIDYAEFLSYYRYLGNSEGAIKSKIRDTIESERDKIESERSKLSILVEQAMALEINKE